MRALVTGGNGFVGRHLVAELLGRGDEVVVAGRAEDGGAIDVALDLADPRSVHWAVVHARPDVVYHLAAQAFVPDATRAPLASYDTNILGTARVVEALRASDAAPRLVYVSSGEVYGAQRGAGAVDETTLPEPATIYAASKLAGEAVVLASVRSFGIRALVTRAFNHVGPGQSDRFVVPAFAKRLASIAAGGPSRFPVGNLGPQRDFLDVRDVVRAYADLARDGSDGETYNVSSGAATTVAEVLRVLVEIAGVAIDVVEDPALVRPIDVPVMRGANAKLRAATGWYPKIALADSLRAVYAEARARLAIA